MKFYKFINLFVIYTAKRLNYEGKKWYNKYIYYYFGDFYDRVSFIKTKR